MNRIIVIIEAEHHEEQGRFKISRTFRGDITRDQALDVFADALRGAGYQCGIEALHVEDEPTIPVTHTPLTCRWIDYTNDSEGESWRSACGERWMLTNGGPVENHVRFCHGCGKPVLA